MTQVKPKNNRPILENNPKTGASSTGRAGSGAQTTLRQARLQRRKNKRNQLLILFGLGAVALIIVVATALFMSNSQDSSSSVNQALLVQADSFSRGPGNVKVTVVEFLDPECEACRAAYPQVEELVKEYEGRVRFVVRYFTGHNNSMLAIAATEGAGEQGKYLEMQTLLFNKQSEWGEQRTPQTERFIAYAQSLGLDLERFKTALQNPAYAQKANRDSQDAQTLKVQGTPTFFVNGKTLFGMNKASLKTMIDQALRN